MGIKTRYLKGSLNEVRFSNSSKRFLIITTDNPKVCYHVYSSDIPRQPVPTPIHNHRFIFTSEIIIGSLINVQYRIEEALSGCYHVAFVVNQKSSNSFLLKDTSKLFNIIEVQRNLYSVGEWYQQNADSFHQIIPLGFCIARITKTAVQRPGVSEVMVPKNFELDNEFTNVY